MTPQTGVAGGTTTPVLAPQVPFPRDVPLGVAREDSGLDLVEAALRADP